MDSVEVDATIRDGGSRKPRPHSLSKRDTGLYESSSLRMQVVDLDKLNPDTDGDGQISASELKIYQLLRAQDTDGDGKLTIGELYNGLAALTKVEKKRSMYTKGFFVLLAVSLIQVLLIVGLVAGIFVAMKDQHVTNNTLADDHGAVIRVSEATAHVPLYTLAAMPLDALGRVHQLSVAYSVRSEKEQRHLEIASRSKRGNAVELADALGYTVRLVGTSLAVLVTPDGSKYTVCEADVSCSSVEVSNADLEALELAAIDMRVAEEDEDPSMSDDRRRLHRSDRRRLARRSLQASGCVLDPSPVLGVPGAPCKEGLRYDVDLTQCEKLAASPPAHFFPNSLGDSHHPGGQVAGHWSGLPHGCQFFVDGPESTYNRILFNNANSDSALKYNPRNLPTSLCAADWCLSSYSSMICNEPYRPAHPAESGCFVYLPSGCPNHVSFSSGDWARDDYGENTLNVKSSTPCEKRKGAYDSWCGVSDAVMLFVVDRATQAKLQDIAESDGNCQHLSDASKALAPPPELKALMQMAKTVQSDAQLETNPATPTCMDISGYTRIESAYACAEALGLNPAEAVAPKSKGGFIHEGSGKTLPCGCMKGTELHRNQDQHLFVPYLSGCVDETSCFASGYNCICQPDSSVTVATQLLTDGLPFGVGAVFDQAGGNDVGEECLSISMGGDAKNDLYIYLQIADYADLGEIFPMCVLARPCSPTDIKFGFYSGTGIPLPIPPIDPKGEFTKLKGAAVSPLCHLAEQPKKDIYLPTPISKDDAFPGCAWVAIDLVMPITGKKGGKKGGVELGEAEIAATFLLNTKISSQTSQPVYIGETIEAVVKGGDALEDLLGNDFTVQLLGNFAGTVMLDASKILSRKLPDGPSLEVYMEGTTYHELQTTPSDGQLRIQMSYNGDAEFDMDQMVQLVLGGGVLASFVPPLMGKLKGSFGYYFDIGSDGVAFGLKGEMRVRLMNCEEEPARTFKSLIEGAKDILATAPEALRGLFDKVAGVGIDVLCQENNASFQVTSSASSTYDFEAKIGVNGKEISSKDIEDLFCHDLSKKQVPLGSKCAKNAQCEGGSLLGIRESDIVGFSSAAVVTAPSNGYWFRASFSGAKSGLAAMTEGAGGWTTFERYPRFLADIDGDGAADIVGFGDDGVVVAKNTGRGAFEWPVSYTTGYAQWYSQNTHPRAVADVDGDGCADIVGFGDTGVYVSLSRKDSFAPAVHVLEQFGGGSQAGTWTSFDSNPRFVADVNGDGKADIIGKADTGFLVSLSTATRHKGVTTPSFAQPTTWSKMFLADSGWDSFDKFPCAVADVDGDGKADLVAFGSTGVYVAYSNGRSFVGGGVVLEQFRSAPGYWSSFNLHPRLLADVNGDGRADIIGFSPSGVYVSVSLSTRATPFTSAAQWSSQFVWSSFDQYPVAVAEINPVDLWCDTNQLPSISVLCTGTCQAKRLPGEPAPNVFPIPAGLVSATDGAACQSGEGICNVCADHDRTVPDGSKCSTNSDCSSGWCDGIITAGCQGTCKPKKENGETPYRSVESELDVIDPWDPQSCISGRQNCGTCHDGKIPTHRPCSKNDECASSWCRGDFGGSGMCGGTCLPRKADGEACDADAGALVGDDHSCLSGYCRCGTCAISGTAGKLHNSATCATNDNCASDVCDGAITFGCAGTCRACEIEHGHDGCNSGNVWVKMNGQYFRIPKNDGVWYRVLGYIGDGAVVDWTCDVDHSGRRLESVGDIAAEHVEEVSTLAAGEQDQNGGFNARPAVSSAGDELSQRRRLDRISNDDRALESINLKCTHGFIVKPLWCNKAMGCSGVWDGDVSGVWSGWSQCPGFQRFTGFRIKNEAHKSGHDYDDTGMNAAGFWCASTSSEATPLRDGPWGGWDAWMHCPAGFSICGARIRYEGTWQTSHDSAGMTNLAVKCCNHNNWNDQSEISGRGYNWGDWKPWVMCPANEYAGAFRAKVTPPQGGAENFFTAIGDAVSSGWNDVGAWAEDAVEAAQNFVSGSGYEIASFDNRNAHQLWVKVDTNNKVGPLGDQEIQWSHTCRQAVSLGPSGKSQNGKHRSLYRNSAGTYHWTTGGNYRVDCPSTYPLPHPVHEDLCYKDTDVANTGAHNGNLGYENWCTFDESQHGKSYLGSPSAGPTICSWQN